MPGKKQRSKVLQSGMFWATRILPGYCIFLDLDQNLCIFLERKIHTAFEFQKSFTCERMAWGRGKVLTYKDCIMLERESFLKAHFRKFLFLLSIGLFASRQPLIQGHQILYSCLSFLLYEDHHKFIWWSSCCHMNLEVTPHITFWSVIIVKLWSSFYFILKEMGEAQEIGTEGQTRYSKKFWQHWCLEIRKAITEYIEHICNLGVDKCDHRWNRKYCSVFWV